MSFSNKISTAISKALDHNEYEDPFKIYEDHLKSVPQHLVAESKHVLRKKLRLQQEEREREAEITARTGRLPRGIGPSSKMGRTWAY